MIFKRLFLQNFKKKSTKKEVNFSIGFKSPSKDNNNSSNRMACNPDQSDGNKVPPVIHVRADSDSCLEELFTFGLKPPGAQPMMQKPLRQRNLPQSFFNPPNCGGSRSPSCHSRENSFDSSSLVHHQQPYSPMQQPVGSPQPQGGAPGWNCRRSFRGCGNSANVNLRSLAG